MQAYRWAQAEALVQRINSLREPYRGNAIAWLEACTKQRIEDVSSDLATFLESLNPTVRDRFVLHTRLILDDAVRFFGEDPS
ncbi:MAG: hypothetical protein AB1449_03250 [Chloroflexota bacterium]